MSSFNGTVTVVGAGTMGRGIAFVSLLGGLRTRLVDIEQAQIERARRQIDADVEEAVRRGKLSREEADERRRLLETGTELEPAARGADLVVESVVEQVDVKTDVLRRAEAAASPEAVLASNTSAISITELSACLNAPERLVGMHFFNPVPRMRLCELVRGLSTSDRALELARAAATRMGKQTVVVDDSPGFITSRMNALIGNEAFRMLEEGIASAEDIDTALRTGLNHPMGPLELADLVGLDVRLAVLEYLERRLGSRYRPTNLQRKLVAAGRLGRKTGAGVYTYAADGTRLGRSA